MNKGLLLRFMEKLRDRGLKTQAAEILAPKVPKTIFIARLAHLGYSAVRRNLLKVNLDDLGYVFNDGATRPVFRTAEEAADKTMHNANWGYSLDRNADALVVVELGPEALSNHGEWGVRMPPTYQPISAKVIPIAKSEYDMYYIDHDMIEDANDA